MSDTGNNKGTNKMNEVDGIDGVKGIENKVTDKNATEDLKSGKSEKENKMGTIAIPKLVLSMSLPAIFAMLVQALYNVVDSIFVSQISDTNNDALTAVSLAFPLQLIVIAVFVGLSVGMNALISRKLGEKDHKTAVLVAENGVMIGAVVYVVVAVLGYTLARPFYELFTDNQIVIDYAVEYTQIVMIFAFGRILAQSGNSILQGTGEMVKPMITMLIGAVLNMILDPILIFGWFGLPAMGVEGAAIATVAAQIVSMLYIWRELIFGNNIIRLDIKNFKPRPDIIKQVLVIGIPVSIMQGLGSVMLTVFNLILSQFGNVAIDVMGAYFKLQSMVFMPVFGLSTGTMPIIGYNLGAKNKKRMTDAIKFSIIVATVFMVFCLAIFQIFGEQLLSLYNADAEMMRIGLAAFRTISLMFPLLGVSIMFSTSFQAFGKAHYSLIASLTRQLIVLLPAAYFLSLTGRVEAVWYSFLIAEVFGMTLTVLMFRSLYHKSVDSFA